MQPTMIAAYLLVEHQYQKKYKKCKKLILHVVCVCSLSLRQNKFVLKPNCSTTHWAFSGCVVAANKLSTLDACFLIVFRSLPRLPEAQQPCPRLLTDGTGSSNWTPAHLVARLTVSCSRGFVFLRFICNIFNSKANSRLKEYRPNVLRWRFWNWPIYCHVNQSKKYWIRPSRIFSFWSKAADKLVQVIHSGLRFVTIVRAYGGFLSVTYWSALHAYRRRQQQYDRFTVLLSSK